MSEQPSGRYFRLRTAATDKRKALDHYQELRRTGRVATSAIVAVETGGNVTILGQGLTPWETKRLLLDAAQAIDAIEAQKNVPKREDHAEPDKRGVWNHSAPRAKKITIAADGSMIPPPGENVISCGVCNHPRWHILHHNDTDDTSRYACAHCGNEVENIQIFHDGGTA